MCNVRIMYTKNIVYRYFYNTIIIVVLHLVNTIIHTYDYSAICIIYSVYIVQNDHRFCTAYRKKDSVQ